MEVLIDADACPVTRITVALCRQFHVPCRIYCDTAHSIQLPGARTLVRDKGADSVDFAIVGDLRPGDLVITQDYGLAAMCLSRGARVLHQDGHEYSSENIDALLTFRHASARARRGGFRQKGPSRRTHREDAAFSALLTELLTQSSGTKSEDSL